MSDTAVTTLLAVLIAAIAIAILSGPEREEPPVTTPDTFNPAVRPEPLQDAASDATKLPGYLIGGIGGLVAAGTLSAATGNLILGLCGLLFAVLPYISARIAAYRTADTARDKVTPDSDPMKVINGELVALAPVGRHTRPTN